MSYSTSAERTTAVATALAELGVRPGDRVLITLPDGPDFAEAFAGTIQHQAVPLPVNPLLSAPRHRGNRHQDRRSTAAGVTTTDPHAHRSEHQPTDPDQRGPGALGGPAATVLR
jgi:acyl-CoA synthetase (AMP-forming)/AMP-acid ligase II